MQEFAAKSLHHLSSRALDWAGTSPLLPHDSEGKRDSVGAPFLRKSHFSTFHSSPRDSAAASRAPATALALADALVTSIAVCRESVPTPGSSRSRTCKE